MKTALRFVLLPALAVAVASPAAAQTYPTRPIRVITAVSAGGTADLFLRTLGEELHKRLGQPFIVEPRPGGHYNIAGQACADAPPDGYTICMFAGETFAFNKFLYKKLGYDPAKDFAPITNMFFLTTALVVNASLNVRSLDELAALAKARPKTLAYVTPNLPHRVFFERFNAAHGIDLVGVPFKGGADALNGVLSGSTPVAFFGLASFLPLLRDGKVIGLAVDSAERSPLAPDIPTLGQLGYPPTLARIYYGLAAPAATPKPMIAKLHAEITAIMSDPEFRRKHLIEKALVPVANSPEEFAAFLEQDRILSEKIVKEAGIELQ